MNSNISTNKHMPIGIHAGPGGNLDGAGQPDGYWVQLAKAGKKPVLKSVSNYGPIFEALGWCDKYGVEGVFVYRITGVDETGFNFDVPTWSLDATSAATYHVEKILAKLPPEFDKRVVLEIINEPDKDQDDTRPSWISKDFAIYLNQFGLIAAQLLNIQGYRVAMYGFSAGEPELDDYQYYLPYLRYCAKHHDKAAIALHEYSLSSNLLSPKEHNPFLIGRFQFIFDICDENNVTRPTIYITEFGWTLWENADEQDASIQFNTVLDYIYGPYPEVVMLALWYSGPGFNDIANLTVRLFPLITDLGLNWELELDKEPEPPTPPVPNPTALDLAIYFTPLNEFGPIYTLTNNWGEGPERVQLQHKNKHFSYITKNDNWERRFIGEEFIYLQCDTSRSNNEFYTVDGPWLPRYMTPGAIFARTENVTIWSKSTCENLSNYTMKSAMRFDGLTDVPLPWERSQALSCAKFTWLTGENFDHEEESYWYAPYIGLVKWKSLTSDKESVISEFVPSTELNNPINYACPYMGEWISEPSPTEPPPPPPPLPPESEYNEFPRGLDISHWQGDLNPEIAMEEGANFVYIKATQGLSHLDTHYHANTAQANNFGMLSGSYHFFDPDLDAANQAEFFCQIVKGTEEQYLPPAIDLESLKGSEITDANAYRKQILTFLAIVEDQLQTPIIYTNKSWYETYLNTSDFEKYDLWIASWHNGPLPYLPSRNEDWLFWQFGVRDGDAYGVDSNSVDVNYANFETYEELYELFNNNWLNKPNPPPSAIYFPAPRRIDYRRTCHVIHDGMTQDQKNQVWKLAQEKKETIMFSYDDAGSTPVTDNTAICHGLNTDQSSIYATWFKTNYPGTKLIFPQIVEEKVSLTASTKLNLEWEKTSTEEEGFLSRLRRTLVRLLSTVRPN